MKKTRRLKTQLKNLIAECLSLLDELEETKKKERQIKKEKTINTTNVNQGIKFWNEERLNYLREHAHERNKTLAQYFGCTARSVTTARYEYKIKRPNLSETKSEVGRELNKRKIRVWTVEKVELLKEKSFLSAKEAAEFFGVSVNSLNNARKRYKINSDTRSLRRVIPKTNTIKLSEKVFPTIPKGITKSVRIDEKTVIQVGIEEDEEEAKRKYFENRSRMQASKKSGR